MTKVVYLSYDGLTDPLGKSQIIPYISGLSEKGYNFTVISFEKKGPFVNKASQIKEKLDQSSIQWNPCMFTKRPPVLSKIYDLQKFKITAARHCRERPAFTHCRSYVSAQVGLYLKQRFDIPYLFDMRGFWVDERIDKKIWNEEKFLYRKLYQHYKKIEKELLKEAGHICTLTLTSRDYLINHFGIPEDNITVIPCTTDVQQFHIPDAREKAAAKASLNIPANALCLGYLGSLGGWYDLENMLLLFKSLLLTNPGAHFIFYTPEPARAIQSTCEDLIIPYEQIRIRFIEKEELDRALNAFDISILILKDCFSKQACSPTRLAELWSKGIPVMVSEGIGDLNQKNMQGLGVLLADHVTETLPYLQSLDKKYMRDFVLNSYNLKTAVNTYQAVYQQMIRLKN